MGLTDGRTPHGPTPAAVSVSLLCFCCFDSLLTQLYFSFINRSRCGRGGGCATNDDDNTSTLDLVLLLLLLIIVLLILVLLVLLVLLLLVLLVLLLLTGKNKYVMYYVYFKSRFLLL